MKPKMLVIIFAVAVLQSMPWSAAANPIALFNTGAGIAEGQIDTHFRLLSGPTCPNGGCDVYAMVTDGFPIPPYVPNNATSKWIVPLGGSVDNTPAGAYTYRTTFSLEGMRPETAVIDLGWATDNAGLDVLLNGVSLGFSTRPDQFAVGLAWYTIASGFIEGINTLDFVVSNLPCPGCTRNPTAFRAELEGAAVQNPEPASLVLLGTGLAAVALRRKVRRRAQ